MNAAPVANAGPDQVVPVVPGQPIVVRLDASGSTDADTGLASLAFLWTNAAGLLFGAPTAAITTVTPFTTANAGAHVFMVRATDPRGESSTDTVTVWVPMVTVTPPAAPCLVGAACTLSFTVVGFSGGASARATVQEVDPVSGQPTGVVLVPESPVLASVNTVSFVPRTVVGATTSLALRVVVTDVFPSVSASRVVVRSATAAYSTSPPVRYVTDTSANCSAPCGAGERPVAISCQNVTTNVVVADRVCLALAGVPRPASTQPCVAALCSGASFSFLLGAPGQCDSACGAGNAVRTVTCLNAALQPQSDLSLCGAVVPPSVVPCSSGPCDTFAWYTSAFGPCSASCGGRRYRTVACRSLLTGAAAPEASCAAGTKPAAAEDCNGVCSGSGGKYEATTGWGACSATCGGGVSTRTVSCMVAGVEAPATSCADVPAASRPASSRTCNTQPCTTYAYVTGAWSACSEPDGGCGVRTRTVQCAATSASGTVLDAASRCAGLASLTTSPHTQEACGTCGFCDRTDCSGNGVCDPLNSVCTCDVGFTGLLCERVDSATCQGPRDRRGACCPAGSVLDIQDACCSSGVFDAQGVCCAGAVNKCGVCNGPAVAVVSPTGACCMTGVTSADGTCCAAGAVVDNYGVCGGNDASGVQTVQVSVTVGTGVVSSATVAASDLEDPFSEARVAVDAKVEAVFVAALGRPASSVDAKAVVLAARRALAADLARERRLSTAATVTLALTPFGGANFVEQGQLQDLLQGADDVDLGVGSVVSSVTAGTCGNGVCETGERADGCTQDCPFPILTCPVAAGTCPRGRPSAPGWSRPCLLCAFPE
jgi:hypothetical protein